MASAAAEETSGEVPVPASGGTTGSGTAGGYDPTSLWSRVQSSGVQLPSEVIDKLAELDLELSEGQHSTMLSLTLPFSALFGAWFYLAF